MRKPEGKFTKEELDAVNDEYAGIIERMVKIREAIVTGLGGPWSKGNRIGGAGEITCPCCGGTVRYSRASINGHIHAHCSTEGCASWME